jgi:hypothetical protein
MQAEQEFELQRLLQLPWTVLAETTPEGDRLLRVVEIPSAVGSGDTDEARERDLWAALEASLRAYLHFGDPVPVPERQVAPLFAASSSRVPGLTTLRAEPTTTFGRVGALGSN